MDINDVAAGLGARTRAFLQRATQGGHELRIESKGEVVRDGSALGRRLMVLGLSAVAASISVDSAGQGAGDIAVLQVSLNGQSVHADPYIGSLTDAAPPPVSGAKADEPDQQLVEALALCSPGLSDIDPKLLLSAYRYTSGWQSSTTAMRAEALRGLAQAYAEVTVWAAESGRSLELGVAAYCQARDGWRDQIVRWDAAATQRDDPREFYSGVVQEHRKSLYSNVVQAQWEYLANHSIASSLVDSGLLLKVGGDYRGWVSAIGSVARGVADATGDSRTQAATRGATGLLNAGSSAARGMERIGEGYGAARRVDQVGRSISDLARLGRSAERLLDGPKGPSARRPDGAQRHSGVRSGPGYSRDGLSVDARDMARLGDAARRMGFRVSLVPLTGEPIPADHPTVKATYSQDPVIARQEAQRNLAEVARLHEYAQASGMNVRFDSMYDEYGRLADAVRDREQGGQRSLRPGDGSRGG